MRKLLFPAAMLMLAAAMDIPSNAASPQVCRGHDEGSEVFTDCYGTALTGNALRDAQIRELERNGRFSAESASVIGIQILTLPADQTTCPLGTARLRDRPSEGEPAKAHIYCAY